MRRRVNRSRNNTSSSQHRTQHSQTAKDRYLHNNSRTEAQGPAGFMHARKSNASPYHPSQAKPVDLNHQAAMVEAATRPLKSKITKTTN